MIAYAGYADRSAAEITLAVGGRGGRDAEPRRACCCDPRSRSGGGLALFGGAVSSMLYSNMLRPPPPPPPMPPPPMPPAPLAFGNAPLTEWRRTLVLRGAPSSALPAWKEPSSMLPRRRR